MTRRCRTIEQLEEHDQYSCSSVRRNHRGPLHNLYGAALSFASEQGDPEWSSQPAPLPHTRDEPVQIIYLFLPDR